MPRIVYSHLVRNNSGFSLIEVLITVVVLSIGLLGMGAMTITTIKSLTFSKDLTTATMLSQNKLEEIREASYTTVTSDNYPEETYNTIPDHPVFRRIVTITSGAIANTKRVAVATFWRDKQSGNSHQVSVQTIISN